LPKQVLACRETLGKREFGLTRFRGRVGVFALEAGRVAAPQTSCAADVPPRRRLSTGGVAHATQTPPVDKSCSTRGCDVRFSTVLVVVAPSRVRRQAAQRAMAPAWALPTLEAGEQRNGAVAPRARGGALPCRVAAYRRRWRPAASRCGSTSPFRRTRTPHSRPCCRERTGSRRAMVAGAIWLPGSRPTSVKHPPGPAPCLGASA